MKHLFIGLAYVGSFLTFVGGMFLSLYYLVQASYNLLPIADFPADSLITSQQFAVYLFSVMTLCCGLCAFGVVHMLDNRAARS